MFRFGPLSIYRLIALLQHLVGISASLRVNVRVSPPLSLVFLPLGSLLLSFVLILSSHRLIALFLAFGVCYCFFPCLPVFRISLSRSFALWFYLLF